MTPRSALQTIHKVSSKAREQNYFLGGLTHDWVSYYEQRIESDRSCLNEWHAMDNIESRRPPSPDSVRTKPSQREETERVIRCTLKEIMMSVDLDEVTSKHIRGRLEEDLDMDLGEFKPFIDEEMLTILGQMDAATEIFDHVYLGSEWNASNHEELQKNGVRHILNVTREIDNFFPGMFNYLNIRVYDDEKTDLLKHWDDTFKYISRARAEGSKVLVHCKMGVSRSASVVIAYAMKAYNWDFKKAFEYVKKKRNCIKPNCSFMTQLETYQGILDAMKNREKLQRSKSETNLKSPCFVPKENSGVKERQEKMIENVNSSLLTVDWTESTGTELSKVGGRPKSWSPDNSIASVLFTDEVPGPVSMSMEYLNSDDRPEVNSPPRGPTAEMCPTCRTQTQHDELPCKECFKVTTLNPQEVRNRNSHMRIPRENGQTYSVSQNRIVYLPGSSNATDESDFIPYVRNRVIEFESQSGPMAETTVAGKKLQSDRKGLVLNLTSQFETSCSKSGSPTEGDKTYPELVDPKLKNPQLVNSILVKEESWDPGEKKQEPSAGSQMWTSTSEVVNGGETELPFCDGKTGPTRREGDPFSDKLDRVFDREERKQFKGMVPLPPIASAVPVVPLTNVESCPTDCPSRQNSWSSYDSAVVLSYQGESREAPSRQSSWGSGDIPGVPGALPSRNSSWGSYDMRPAGQVRDLERLERTDDLGGMVSFSKDVPWNPGTVKRTRQKLKEVTAPQVRETTVDEGELSSSLKPEISVCNLKIHGPKPYQTPVLSKDLKTGPQVVEAVNAILVHYASTPTLSLQPSLKNTSISADKMTASQPNITILQEEAFPGLQHTPDQLSLSASVPDNYIMNQNTTGGQMPVGPPPSGSVRQQKQVLENLTNKCCVLPKRCISVEESMMATTTTNVYGVAETLRMETEAQKSVSGMVQNLKKEFEAKSVCKSDKATSEGADMFKQIPTVHQEVSMGVGSPSSVAINPEDLSVKNLVGKYEINKNKLKESEPGTVSNQKSHTSFFASRKPKLEMVNTPSQLRVKHSSLFLHNLKNSNSGEKVLVLDGRPPSKTPSPSVVVASVVAKAASKKQQQGKTHPLAHLTINPRHSNAVYNTM
ncbi:hypothetical protein RUM43_005342 [Polyplax serrata]|uniref:protein-serine/threonine phosphatase n=1 Tax=Polyplax serrata TaxID=468196 RepID=A0AAN8P939_POLSC